MGPVVQVAGSLLIVAAFVGVQVRRLDPQSWTYLLLNLVGSGVLAVDAWLEQQWGFLLLEVVWATVSAGSIVAKLRGRDAPASH